jgi:hypothetical protein
MLDDGRMKLGILAAASLILGAAGGFLAFAESGRPEAAAPMRLVTREAEGAGQAATLPAKLAGDLERSFDLAAARTPQVQYFRMETIVVHIGFDGKRTGTEDFILTLKSVPAALSGKGGDEYTCKDFLYKTNDGKAVSIPALTGWSYVFVLTPTGRDEKGQVLGIPHAKFENLVDSGGKKIPVNVSYFAYNAFVDFHSFNDVFARPTQEGKGIQNLTRIGQRIIHDSAFSEPPTNLGAGIKEGSVFRNGEISLEFKGVSVVDGAACALVGYDSGESTLKMIVAAGPNADIVTTGGSQYKGDLFIDLATRRVRKATMDEFVVSQTTVPGVPQKVDGYTVRHLLLRNITREEYEKN